MGIKGRVGSIAKSLAIGGLALFAVIQLVPYGRDHANPPVTKEPRWDHPSTRSLAERACFDCHSNATRWPWYSRVAPVSWVVQRDVDVGRRELNFSEWDHPQEEADKAAETVLDGEMPPATYLVLHPSARLSAEEKRQLAQGLIETIRSTHKPIADVTSSSAP